MDLAVRASLKGWKFVYVGHVKVPSPLSFLPVQQQQHYFTNYIAKNIFKTPIIRVK